MALSHRAELVQELNKQVIKARTSDLSRTVSFLKTANEVAKGKVKKRRESKLKQKQRQIEKLDLPFWWSVVE